MSEQTLRFSCLDATKSNTLFSEDARSSKEKRMNFASEERLTVVDHPLIRHKLSVIRNEDTPDYLFRPDCA